MQKYCQTKNLKSIFDLSADYFEKRMNAELLEGIHYFIPPTNSKTKKAILWEIDVLESWIRGESKNEEIQKLLHRK